MLTRKARPPGKSASSTSPTWVTVPSAGLTRASESFGIVRGGSRKKEITKTQRATVMRSGTQKAQESQVKEPKRTVAVRKIKLKKTTSAKPARARGMYRRQPNGSSASRNQ